jgi:PDZ domain
MKTSKLTLSVLLAMTLSNGLFVLADNAAESDAVLKPDVPKFDGEAGKRKPLKGAIQHSEKIVPKSALKGGTNDGANLSGKGSMDSGHSLRGKAKSERAQILNAEAQSGVGIIGVKFVMGMGRPPTIYRVFPGTPAWENGLRARDIIVAVDGIPTFGLSKDEVYNMIVGAPHTPVTISFRRNSDFQVRKMERMDFNDITDPRVRQDYQNM